MKKYAGRSLRGFLWSAGLWKLGLPCLLLGLTVNVARALPPVPANDNFVNALVITNISGTANGVDNSAATMETNEVTPVLCDDDGLVDITNSVWYKWTAPTNGTVRFNTIGSGFDTVLVVYTASSYTNGSGVTNLAYPPVGADDDNGFNLGGDTNNYTSQLSFTAVVGTTYYISVAGNADDLNDAVGAVVLSWSYSYIPPISSGTFRFTRGTNIVSETDSTSPNINDGVTVSAWTDAANNPPSNLGRLGGRLTVTRTAPANGRVLVDYQFLSTNSVNYSSTNGDNYVNYNNYFFTNVFSTNITVTFINTNGVEFITNDFLTYTVYSNYFEYYDGGYKTNVIPGDNFNFTQSYSVNTGLIIATNFMTNEVIDGIIIPFPPGVTAFTNILTGYTNLSLAPGEILSTNIFSSVLATNNVDSGVVPGTGQTMTVGGIGGGTTYTLEQFDITNTTLTVGYGTNVSLNYYYPGGGVFSTNIDITNLLVETLYYTNAIYTNGSLTLDSVNTNLLVTNAIFYYAETDRTNNPGFVTKNIGNGTTTIPQTNPPIGRVYLYVSTNITYPSSTVFNSDGSSYTYLTNISTVAQTTNQQVVLSTMGITATNGTLTFDDYQMSQELIVPVTQTAGPDRDLPGVSSVAEVILLNPRLDTNESLAVSPPTIDPVLGKAVVSALSTTFDPGGGGVANFERSTWRVRKDEGSAIVSVIATAAGSINYTVDGWNGQNQNLAGFNHTFPLEAGSDYATPNSDFTPETGTLTFSANALIQTITIPILNNSLVEFNEDLQLSLSTPNNGLPVGEVGVANLTILFDDLATSAQEPAGAADRTWNRNGVNISDPPFIAHPGTDGNGGTVYAVAEQPDGKVIVAGSFNSFDQNPYNRIVRLLGNGYQDTTFLASPNSGANDFISALALQGDGKIIIAGNFTSFNGVNRHHIARLNSDGSLDTTFNPGLGANGMVWSVALETNGQAVIGGAFTSVNGTALNGVARLNFDGSVDTSFNPGIGPDGTVNAVALDSLGKVIIGGDFDKVSGVICGGVARLNVDGTLDTTFSPGIGTYNSSTGATDPVYALAVQNDGQILIGGAFSYFDLVNYNGIVRLNTDGTVDLSFNPGTGTYNPLSGYSDTIYDITLQINGEILIGGDFTTYNQTRRVGIARLYSDGTVDSSFMDTAYNQFAGVPNHYYNSDAVNPLLYPPTNNRNYIYSMTVEEFTNVVTTQNIVTNNSVVTTNFITSTNITGGNVIVGGNFSYVGGGSTRDDVRPRSNVARLIGGYTPGPGNMELLYNSYSADKNISGGGLFVSLQRSSINSQNPGVTNNLGIVTVTFSTNTALPGPGIANGNNFSLNPAYSQPTWTTAWSTAAWMYDYGVYGPNYATTPLEVSTAYVYVGISNDPSITGNLNANFALSNPSSTNFTLGGEVIPLGAALGTQTAAQLTIIDNNITPGVLGFSPTNFYVNDNGGTATVTVLRSGGSDGVVSVSYATSDGTATNGVNYTGVTGTLTFGQDVVSNSFTIPVITQSSSSPDRTDKMLGLRLYNVTGGASLGLNTNAALWIINHNYAPGHVEFSSGVPAGNIMTYSTNENSVAALITVNRVGGSSSTMSVTVVTSNGSATNGVNYIGSTNVLSWAANDATPKTISIPVMDDGLVTTNLTVFLSMINPRAQNQFSASVLGLSHFTNATLYINNVDSSGTVQFSSPAYSVKKYGGFALVPVERVGGIAQTLTVNYFTSDSTAIAGINYTNTSGTLTFTNGETGKFFQVPIIDNGTNDGLKFLTVSLTNAFPTNSLGVISNATVNILDTEPGTNFPSLNETPGSADANYDPLGLNNTAYALALQPNNQLVIGGDFTFANGVPRQRIARLNSDGTLDAAFSKPSSAYGASDSIRALALQSDGRILVGGFFTNFNSVAINRIVRLNYDGSLDSLFNPGSGADNPVYAIAATTNDAAGLNEIYIGGSFATVGGTSINGIARLNNDGTLDTTFNPGLGANGTVFALALQSDGKVVIGGDFTAINGNTNFNHIARLNTDGSTDFTFNPGTGPNDSVKAITLQPNGEILIGGIFTNVNGIALSHIARLNANGSVDISFQPGVGASDTVSSIALQTDSRIVLGGQFAMCSGVTRSRITRLNPNGSVDPTINFGYGANNFVAAIVVEEDVISGYPTNVPDEKIIIGGGFTQYNGQSHPYLARIYGGSIGGSGAYEFSLPNYQVDEKGTNAVITIVRTGGTSGPNFDGSGDVFVPAFTSDGSATAGVNYLAVSNYLDFPEGEVIRTITIPVMDDGVITTNLTVNLAVNPAPPAAFGDQPTAVLTIINDDSAIVFSSANYQVPKTIVSGVAAINIQRIGSTNGISTVVFNTTTNGTALVGTDYTPVTNVTVTFNPGVTNIVVPVPINNNGLAEGNQTVTMQLSNAVGSLLYSPSNATLTIIETVFAPGQLSFTATNYNYLATDPDAYLTVVRNNGYSGIVTVNYATAGGTAAPGIDFAPTNGVLAFGDGVTNLTIAVPLIQNGLVQGPVTVPVNLSNPTGGATLGTPTSATVTILNTNTAVSFALATNVVAENAGYVSLTVLRQNNTNGIVTVNYATTNGTAVAGTNYTASGGTLTFADGQASTNILVPLIYDPAVTGDLRFTVGLWGPSSPAQLIAPSVATIVEQDADAGINFATATMSVLKNGTNAVIAVVCSNPRVEPVTVGYVTADGTATNGIDYIEASGTLVFVNGVATNYITVPIINNTLLEGNVAFAVALTNATYPGQLVAPAAATVTILDSNPGISFSSPAYAVAKTGLQALINVQRTGFTDSVVSVNFATSDGTAISGQDYVATNGVLVFTNGVTNMVFTVPVVNRLGVQPPKTVQLSLANVTGGVPVAPTNATLTILDSTNTVLTFALSTNTVPENAGFATLSVLRLNNTSGTVTVNYTTTDGTAVAGTNYITTSGTLTFTNGQFSQTIIVPLIYNPLVTGDLQFTVALSSPSSPAQLISPSVTTVIEQDVNADVSFASSTSSVLKSAGYALINVVCSNPNAGLMTVNYMTVDGTATNGVDYIGPSQEYIITNNTLVLVPGFGTLVLGGGITTNQILVPIINNNLPEGNTTFSVVLFGLAGAGTLVAPETNVVTIIDSNPHVSFSSPVYAVSKTGVQASINVYRTGYTDSVMSVDYATADGTAISGSDYVATGGTLVFTNGVTNQTFTVTVVNQLGVQPPKTVQLSLLNPTNAILAMPDQAVLTILDNTNAAFTFAAATNTVAANYGTVAINVLRLNNPNGTMTVDYQTADGTATAGNNYTQTNGTLIFTDGVTSQMVLVPLIANSNLAGSVMFTVGLTNPSSPAQLIAPSVSTVIEQYSPANYYSQPDFTNALVISGDSGSASVNNTGVLPDPGAPTIAGNPPNAPVWFAWTAKKTGEVEFDTLSSYATNGIKLDTVMGVYTGNNLATLNLVAANDDLYPNTQYNYVGQNIYTFGDTNGDYAASTNPPIVSALYGTAAESIFTEIQQPFTGPSGLRFNAVAGTTYYIAVDTKPNGYVVVPYPPYDILTGNGTISLNWSYHPSGIFRFATENSDLTGLTNSDGTPMLLYQCAASESSGITVEYADQVVPEGVLVTVTRVAGYYGRVTVDYTTADLSTNSSLMGTNGFLINGDLPASSTYQYVYSTNGLLLSDVAPDYVPVSGTLTFDDFEMSKSIVIPVYDSDPTDTNGNLTARPNRDFTVVLSNPQRDPAESGVIPTPRVDQIFGQALVRILDVNADPKGPTTFNQRVVSVGTNGVSSTNNVTVYSTGTTNAIFNFEASHYYFDRRTIGTNNAVSIYVSRTGTNTADTTINYTVNTDLPFENAYKVNQDYLFPLSAGSDYATPNPPTSGNIRGKVADFDFAVGGGYTGTLEWKAGDLTPKPITFNVLDNKMPQFNEDFQIDIYGADKNGKNPFPVGMVNVCTVTILPGNGSADSAYLPAGSVDELYNADFGEDFFVTTAPPQMTQPGTDGEIYGMAVQPDDRAIVVGDFYTYDLTARNCIARVTTSGYLDTSFNPGSGANDFISCITLTTNNEVLIGGNFTSFNGSLCDGIALLNTDGSLDTSFNPGLGFNGTVNALALQPDGRVLVGGNFTSYNGVPRNYIARLNIDGSLDATFNPGISLNAQVLAITLQSSGQVVVGGDFTAAGGVKGQDHLARLNADGTFDPTFDPGSGANASVFALATQPDGNILVGGEFSVLNGQNFNNIARLNSNGYTDPNFFCGVGADGPVYSFTVNTNPIVSRSQFNTVISTNATTGVVQTNTTAVVIQTGFTIYVGGEFTSYNGTHRLGFARLNSDGTVDTTFLDTAYNQFAGLTREYYGDPVGTVLASGIQRNGNVLIGGSFTQVGGGELDGNARPEDLTNNVYAINFGETRASMRNHNNFARLLGGATPGPGNVGLSLNSYSVNKSVRSFFVSLVRNNGLLGPASANFSVIPGLAQSGADYSYAGGFNGASPLYWISWEYAGPSRMHSDGFYGNNLVPSDGFNTIWSGVDYADVYLTLTGSAGSTKNLSAEFQMSNPSGADEFYLGGEDIPLGVALGEPAAPLTLIDDHHQSGIFGFASSNYIGTGQSVSIGVTRTNGAYGVVSLNYATTTNGSTAILNSDYSAVGGTLTFQPSDTLQTFNVPILSSNYNSSVEKFVNIQLSGLNPPANGLATFNVTNTVLRIINPNFQGYLNLSASAYSANVSAGSVAVTVTRTVGSKGTLAVQFATADGTATSGVDYIGNTNTLQWNDGDVSPRTIVIPLLNNNLFGNGSYKQFGVALSNPTLNGVVTPSLFGAVTNATVTIVNDITYGTLQFSAPAYVVNENGGYATLTVVRTGSTNGTATVNYTNINVTALAGTNYVAAGGTLTFVPGQTAANIVIRILDDGKTNPPPAGFFFQTSLYGVGTGATIGSPATANVNIVDAESFNRPPGNQDTTFNTGTGMNSDVFALALQSTGKILAGGNFNAVNGVPENYVARLNTDGSLDRSGFLYGLSGASGAIYAIADQADDQILVGGTFTNFNGTVLNRIARLNTDGTLDSSFNPGAGADGTVYAIAETFIGGSREVYAGGGFSIMNGVSRPYVVRLDDSGNVDKSFSTGTGPSAPVYAVAVYPTNSPFAGKVLVGGAFTNINNFAVGSIARLNGDGSIDTNFDLNLNAGGTVRAIAVQNDGRVVFGGDFTNVDGITLNRIARLNTDGSLDTNFVSGVGVGANGTVSALAIQADNRIVVGGQFTQASGVTRNGITRLMPDGTVDPTINFGDGANGAVNAVVVQPADQMLVIGGSFTQYNDRPAGRIARIYGGSVTGSGQFTFTSAAYQVNENGIQALIGVRRVGGTSGTNANFSGDVFVNFATSDGTATNGVNYAAVVTNVDFPEGEVLKLIPVPVMNNSNVLPNLTVNLTLSTNVPGLPTTILGDQATAVLTIINVNSDVSFGSANYLVAKNILTGFGVVNVVRNGATNSTCSVDYLTTTNGSAVIGTDYYPTNGTIVFNPGDTNKIIQVPIINNNVAEGNRTVLLSLSNAVNIQLVAPTNTALTIIDTVQSPGLLAFSATNYAVNASDGNATVTVVRTNGTTGSVTVGYTTVQGTALPGVNYQTVSGTLTFNEGDINKSFSIPLINQYNAQSGVGLSVVLSNPTGGAALSAPTNATVTILNTNSAIAFQYTSYTNIETAGSINVFVQRMGSLQGTATINYATTNNGTAMSGTNYTPVSGTLTFNGGQSLQAINIPLIDDPQVTGNLTFGINLFSPTNTQMLSPSNATVVVLDADVGLSFTNATASVLKNTGTAVISVVCSNPALEPTATNVAPLSVNYFTSDGTALAGQDYTATSGTLLFTNGLATNTFTVPIINNSRVTGNRVFTLNLTNATAPGRIISPSNQVVTIIDNNSGLSFSSAAYTVARSSGTTTITVLRTDNTNQTTSVNFATLDGTAVAGTDYIATNGTFVFTNGQTSMTFQVMVIANTAVQPDKTVLLQLTSPVNGILVAPSAAVLTIHDTSGSLVVPDGSALVSGSTNGIIYPGGNITLLFAFREAAGSPGGITGFSATLLATNGVTSPSPVGAMNPTSLTVGGRPASQAWNFTASGTNGQQIAATFQLYTNNGAGSIGTAVFTYSLGTWKTTVANTNLIIINPNTTATPYPSEINVSGVGGQIIKATVTLTNLYHTAVSSVDALVVAPNQQDTLIMANAGGPNAVGPITLTFDDASTNSLPRFTPIVSGTNQPTAYLPVPNFP